MILCESNCHHIEARYYPDERRVERPDANAGPRKTVDATTFHKRTTCAGWGLETAESVTASQPCDQIVTAGVRRAGQVRLSG